MNDPGHTSSPNPKGHPPRFITHLFLIGATFFWGLNPMIMKVALAEIPPLPFNSIRLLVGTVASLIMFLLSRTYKPMNRKDLARTFAVAFFGFFGFQAAYSFGVHYTAASIGAIILALLPVFVVIINRISGYEPLTRRALTGIMITFSGIILITFGTGNGFSTEGTLLIGVLLLLFSEAAYGGFTVFVKPLLARYSIYQILTIVVSLNFVLFLIISMKPLIIFDYSLLSPAAWWSMIYSGFFGICVGNFFWNYGIRHIGSTNTSVYGNLPPVFGIAAGYLFLGEILGPIQITGALVVLLGVYIVNKGRAVPAGTT